MAPWRRRPGELFFRNNNGRRAFNNLGQSQARSGLMKLLLFFSAAVVGVAVTLQPAEAEYYPWCSNYADGAGVNCGFTSYDQCMATSRGSGGYCTENNYETPPAGASSTRRTRKRAARK